MESLHSFCVKAWIMIVGSKLEGIGYLVGLRAFFFWWFEDVIFGSSLHGMVGNGVGDGGWECFIGI